MKVSAVNPLYNVPARLTGISSAYGGRITDNKGKPIPGAGVAFFNGNGHLLLEIKSSSSGVWRIDLSSDGGLLDDGNFVSFFADGYYSYGVTTNSLEPIFNVSLEKSINKLAILGMGALGGLAIFFATKKGGLSGINPPDKKDYAKYIIPVGVLAGGAFLLYKFFGKSGRDVENEKLAADAARELTVLAQSGMRPTLSITETEALAQSIVTAADDCGTDEGAIYRAFGALSNKADLLLLIKTYGVRTYKACFDGNYFGDTPRNLSATLTSELSSSGIDSINTILRNSGINYKF